MKKAYWSLLLACFTVSVFAQTVQAPAPKMKLSPLTRRYLQEVQKNDAIRQYIPGYIYKKQAAGNTTISALIKVYDADLAQQSLNAIHATVGTKAGNIWTVNIPVEYAQSIPNLKGISYFQMDEPLVPLLDVARHTTRVDSVQAGYGLPMRYSGKGVVMGVIDFGFDYTHPTFYDTLGTTFRIKRVWETNSAGTPPAGYSYGRELTDSNAIRAAGTDNPAQFHGTSTAGMAAGSGFGGDTSNRRYRGMAYGADIVLVGVRRDSIGGQWKQGSFTDFLDGTNYIFNYAASVSKPAVVNISWGSQSGAHDGTSLFNQACDNLSGAGKIIVMSGGNEGTEKIHLSKKFTATDTVLKTFLTFTSPAYQRTWVDIWGDTGKTFCARITLYKNGVAGQATDYVCISDSIYNQYLIGANGTDTCYIQFIASTAEQNEKPRMLIDLYNKAADSIGISIKGTDGSIHLWDEYYYYGYTHSYQSAFDSLGNTWAVSGNTVSTVSDMGSAQSVLLVGAYASKIGFKDLNGNSWSYSGYASPNGLVPFSSRGPMADGRIKPDIMAPGLTIATSMSSFDTAYTPTGSGSKQLVSKYTNTGNGRTYYYAEFTGTSASAPAASGVVALLLQANPLLTPQAVKDALFETAIKDIYTGALPAAGNNNWGHGKINAYGAIKKVIHDVGIYNYTGAKLDCTLFPNPNKGIFSIDYTAAHTETLTVSVYNITGSLITIKNWPVTAGLNQTDLNLGTIASGIYLVHVAAQNGSVDIKTVVR